MLDQGGIHVVGECNIELDVEVAGFVMSVGRHALTMDELHLA